MQNVINVCGNLPSPNLVNVPLIFLARTATAPRLLYDALGNAPMMLQGGVVVKRISKLLSRRNFCGVCVDNFSHFPSEKPRNTS